MNESSDLGPGPMEPLARRVALLGVLLALAGGIVVGLAAWSLIQAREVRRARDQADRQRARVDSLHAVQASAALRGARVERRLGAVEDRVGRMWGGVRRAEVAAVRDWVSRVERRVEENEDRLQALGRDVRHLRDHIRDSLGAVEAPPRVLDHSGR